MNQIKTSVFCCFLIGAFFLPSLLYAEIYGVTCADGTHHPPDFNCEEYMRGKAGSSGSNAGAVRKGYSKPDNRQQEWERQRELEWREQLRRDEEEKIKRDAELRTQFEQDKQRALDTLKSGAGDLGLKGISSGGALELKSAASVSTGLKEPLFSKGYKGSAAPCLGDLDTKWPIVKDLKKVQGNTAEALLRANRSTHILLDALEANPGNWEGSIRYLRNRLADSPNDLAVRDALNLARGYYQGYLRGKDKGNGFYKYGVRQWLEGNFDQAARAFANAYRENPDDKLLFRSFAHSLGLRNGSGQCKNCTACGFVEVPNKRLDNLIGMPLEIREKMKEARAAVAANPENLELRAILNYLDGLAGYQDYLDTVLDKKIPPLSKTDLECIEIGLKKMGQKEYVEGWQEVGKAWGRNADEETVLFAVNYAKGLAAAQRGEFENVPEALWDHRTSEVYDKYLEDSAKETLFAVEFTEPDIDKVLNDDLVEMALEPTNKFLQQIKETETRNPFFGVLSERKMKELRENWSSFFR